MFYIKVMGCDGGLIMKLKQFVSFALCLCLLSGIFIFGSAEVSAVGRVQEIANVVVFVDFADSNHEHKADYFNLCYKSNFGNVRRQIFDGSEEHANSLGYYLDRVSFGQLKVVNVFPQAGTDGSFAPLRLSKRANQYNRLTADGEIIGEIIAELNRTGALSSVNVDMNRDGVIDNLTIVVACEDEQASKNDTFICHKSDYGGMETVSGKMIGSYNLITESSASFGNGAGVVIHEFLHTLGYPDLYENLERDRHPVGPWDIMSQATWYPAYPSAYLRSAVTGWFSIPEVRGSQSCELYSASAATDATKDRQAVILKTDYSDTEFFVVEYRQKAGRGDFGSYDRYIPGSGLIVYRVNLNAETNIDGAPYRIYVFRRGDSFAGDGGERAPLGDGNNQNYLFGSYLSRESGRTSYGSRNISDSLAQNAIVYSDGTNSGIVIKNVGSASGDKISFDVEFSRPQGEYWRTVRTLEGLDRSGYYDFCMDTDGTMFCLAQSGNAEYLYQRKGTSDWSRYTAPVPDSGLMYKLGRYNGETYAGYISAGRAKLAKCGSSGWETVYTSQVQANELSMCSDAAGVYLTFTDSENKNVYVYEHTASGGGLLGQEAGRCGYAANPCVSADKGAMAVVFRDFLDGNRLHVRSFDRESGSWYDVGGGTLAANFAVMKLYQNKVYVAANGTVNPDYKSYLYCCDLSGGSWAAVGNGVFADESITEMDICFVGGKPCIAYYGGRTNTVCAVELENNSWKSVGARVADDGYASGVRMFAASDGLYVSYYVPGSGIAYTKTYSADIGHVHSYQETERRQASCKETGFVTYVCAACGDKYTEELPKTKHSFGPWVLVREPSETADGLEERLCSVCGEKETRSISNIENPFVDVQEGPYSYYYDAVMWAVARGITTGTDKEHFSPGGSCTRAQVVTFIWRTLGEPEPDSMVSPFDDVKNRGDYYYKAVLWAAEKGIIKGVDETHFNPLGVVTRGQFATMLLRLEGEPGHSSENPFKDVSGGYYYDAVLWAYEKNIAGGVGDGLFAPELTCDRGQTVTFLYRYYSDSI